MKNEPCILCKKMTNNKAKYYGKLTPICENCVKDINFEKCEKCGTWTYISDLYPVKHGWECITCNKQ